MKNKKGYLLFDGLVCIVLSSVLCMCVYACMNAVQINKTQIAAFEEEINHSWEEVFSNLKECEACPVEPLNQEAY